MGKIFVAVAGNIGSGKSSLTRLLSGHYGWKALYESVEDNPYLADFYVDMNRWSFNLQVYFLSKRFKDHKKIVEGTESVIQDRSIYEDAEIFAKNLHLIGKMDDRDHTNYRELYGVMMEYLKWLSDMIEAKLMIRNSMTTIEKTLKIRNARRCPQRSTTTPPG